MNELKGKFVGAFLFCLVMTGIMTTYNVSALVTDDPEMIDFSAIQQSEDFYVDLDGMWYFFEKLLLTPGEIESGKNNADVKLVSLPDSFENHTGQVNSFGTYSIIVKIPEHSIGKALAIHVPYQYSAYTLFVDNTEIARNGQVGENASEHASEMSPDIGYFFAQSNQVRITIQVSSFEHIRGGVENSIYFGDASLVSRKFNTNIIGILFINGSIFIIGLFMVLFALYRRQEHVFFIFGMFAMLISMRALFTVPFYYTQIFFNMSWLWGTRLEYILTEASSLFFVILLWQWHKEEFSKKVVYGLTLVHAILIIITLFTQPVFFQELFFKVFYLTIPTFMYLIYVIYKSIRNQNKTAKINLFGMGIIFFAFFNDFAIGNNWYNSINLMLPAVAVYVMIHVILMSKDFAERTKQTEQQYEQLIALNSSNEALAIRLQKEMKQKDDFLANTSHELRNPLHGIINIAQTILHNPSTELDNKIKGNLELQLTIGQHMSQTLGDLLDITRLNENQIKLEKENLNVGAVSLGVIEMLVIQVENKNIEIKMDVAKDFPVVRADKNRFIQILYNLLHNAVKYTEEGTITVSASLEKGLAAIHITDTGIGIDEKTLETIFEPYEQGDSSITAIGGGLGLGLSICRELVNLHDGTIRVESVLGEGSKFTFTLPLSQGLVKEHRKETTPVLINPGEYPIKETKIAMNVLMKAFNKNRLLTYKPKILAVDDDPVNLRVLTSILTEVQYVVEVVTSGKAALEKLASNEWDLVISDVMMPTMSGYELTRIIREKYSIAELPIILLTARGHVDDIYTGFLAGANDYVTKPVDAVELNVRVQALSHLQASINERLGMEAAWLQAQIRPHFLLNTLNAIASLGEIDIARMTRLIENLADYLQKSFYLKNQAKLVPLQDELDLIQAYLYIENERFGDRLKVTWEIDDVKGVMVPPLSIQTLVENALNHGILKRIIGGCVTIRIRDDENYTEITVIDDGVGMDKVSLKEVLKMKPGKKQGIGLINTEQRLKRLYGKGLQITSELDIGTTVTFIIPKQDKAIKED